MMIVVIVAVIEINGDRIEESWLTEKHGKRQTGNVIEKLVMIKTRSLFFKSSNPYSQHENPSSSSETQNNRYTLNFHITSMQHIVWVVFKTVFSKSRPC